MQLYNFHKSITSPANLLLIVVIISIFSLAHCEIEYAYAAKELDNDARSVLILKSKETTALDNIAKDLGFQWRSSGSSSSSSGAKCNRAGYIYKSYNNYFQTDSFIGCEGNSISSLILDGSGTNGLCNTLLNSGNNILNNNNWGQLDNLKNITFKNVDFSRGVPTKIYTEFGNLIELKFIGQCNTSFSGSSSFKSDDTFSNLYIENAAGNLPGFNRYFKNVYVSQSPKLALTINSFTTVFTNNLVSFELYMNSNAAGIGPAFSYSSYLQSTTSLQKLALVTPGFSIQLSTLNQLPQNLKYLHLRGLVPTSTDFPTFSSMSNAWSRLSTLRLEAMGLTGSLDQQFLLNLNLIKFDLTDNPALNIQIPDNFGDRSTIVELRMSNTGINTSLPSDMLGSKYQTLKIFYLTNVPGLKNTLLPEVFLCLPPSFLTGQSFPAYVFDYVTFSNFQGPNTARNCDPIINEIYPIPLPSNSTVFTITGKNFGDRPIILMSNTIGEDYTVNSRYINSTAILCNTPALLQGTGNLTLTSFLSSKDVTKSFTFYNPTITKISSPPTLGGYVTLIGNDLLPYTDKSMKGTEVRIGSTLCQNLTSLIVFTHIACYMPPGITSEPLPVKVLIKGLENIDQAPSFSYRPPSVQTSIAVLPRVETNLTITGSDFWNDVSSISVNIILPESNVTCSVISVSHSILICLLPATDFVPGTHNLQVTVGKQQSATNSLFAFIDTQICPNSCGGKTSGECNVGLGLCNCINGIAGPSCSEGVVPVGQVNSVNSTLPKLILSTGKNNVSLEAYLYSIYENEAETIIPSWTLNFDSATNVSRYQWISGGRSITVVIRPNKNDTPADTLSPGATLNVFDNTFTYQVFYSTENSFGDVKFKFRMDAYPAECSAPDINFVYPSLTNTSVHWLTLTKFDTMWYARFPMIANINGDGGSIDTTTGSRDGLSTLLIVDLINGVRAINTASFQFDFSAMTTTKPSKPVTENCQPGNPNNPNGGSDSTSNKWKITVGVVVGVVGTAIVLAGSVYIYKQQIKLRKTQSLLDKKLRDLNSDL